MNPVETLGLALGAGFSSGLNLYATIATLGLLQRFGVIHLPAPLQVLSHPWVLGIAVALYVIEFLADKIPYVDTRLGRDPYRDPSAGGCDCLLTVRRRLRRRNGAGALRCWPAEWPSLRMERKPARGPQRTRVRSLSAIGR